MCKFRDYDNYEVYEDGRIWSYRKNKFLKPMTQKNGYQKVALTDDNGNKKWYLLHRVVWEAVTGSPIPQGYEINHRNEIKTSNMITNLELLTHKENNNYGSRTKRQAKSLSKQVGAFKNNELVMTFQSTQEAHRNGFNSGCISRCCNCKLPHYKGFIWRYI